MKTRRFSIFCTRDEMAEALCHHIRDERFSVDLYVESAQDSSLEKISLDYFNRGNGDVLWLQNGDKYPPSLLGLVQIVVPKLVGGDLCLSSVAIKTSSSNHDEENARLYRKLVQFFKNKYRSGVWGVNRQYGGEAYYKDIYISDGAIAEATKGVELAPEGGGGFVRFEWRG